MNEKIREPRNSAEAPKAQIIELIEEDLDQVQGGKKKRPIVEDISLTMEYEKAAPKLAT